MKSNKNFWAILAISLLVLCSSCASPSAQRVAGHYERLVPLNGGGELELRVDGTYTFRWEDVADILEPDGSLPASSDVEHGKWTLNGVHVVFAPSDCPPGDPTQRRLYGTYIVDARNGLRPAGREVGEHFRRKPPSAERSSAR